VLWVLKVNLEEFLIGKGDIFVPYYSFKVMDYNA